MKRSLPCHALLVIALLAGCAVQPVEVHVGYQLTGAEERGVLLAAIPRPLLLQLGGLPDPYPPDAPRLLLDLQWVERAKVDFAAASLKPAASNVRVVGLRAAIKGTLTPAPGELRLYAGPLGATSISAPGVLLLARGAWAADGAQHELLLEPAAPAQLASLVSTGSVQVLLSLDIPYDSRANPRPPDGAASADLFLELEILP